MASEIGIGVIGMGWMGQVHSRSYRQIQDRFVDSGIRPQLVICADEAEQRALDGQSRFGFERATADWREVIDDPRVAAISVTTSKRGVTKALYPFSRMNSARARICYRRPPRAPPRRPRAARSCAEASGCSAYRPRGRYRGGR